MELLRFLKQKRSWQLEPLAAVYISPECMQKADLLTKGAALGVGPMHEKSDPTLEICWGQ